MPEITYVFSHKRSLSCNYVNVVKVDENRSMRMRKLSLCLLFSGPKVMGLLHPPIELRLATEIIDRPIETGSMSPCTRSDNYSV